MNKREKILVALVAGVGLLFVGRWGVSQYTAMLGARQSEYDNLKQKLDKIRLEQGDAKLAAGKWLEIGAQTLSMDPDEAKRLFRDQLTELVNTSSMANGTVNMGGGTTSWLRSGIRVLTGTVSAEGSLEKVVSFLFQLYKQPYVVRVRSLTLNQAGTKGQKGVLKMTATVEIPILPSNAIVPQIVPADLSKVKGPGKPKAGPTRTLLASAADYRSIAEKKIFEPSIPPVPPPGKPSSPNPANDSTAFPNASLNWAPSPNAASYKVFFGKAGSGDLMVAQPATRWTPSGLTVGTKYFWHIEAMNASGTAVGDTWTFTVAEMPATSQPTGGPPPTQETPALDLNLVLCRVLSSPVSQQAVLVDPAQANNPNVVEKRVEVGDPLYGGTLILVHPKGAVTETTQGERWFHVIGQAGTAKQRLSEKDQPEVYDELLKLAERAKGISQVPG